MTERPSGRPRTAASRVTVPWVRTRLRTAPGAAAALALLVAVTAFLAAALPPALDRYDEQGMRRALEDAGPARTGVQIQTSDADMFLSDGPWEDLLSRERVEGPFAKLLALPGRALPLDRDQSSAGVRTTRPQKAPDRYLSQPDGVAPVFHLVAQGGVDGHSRLTQGRLPKAPQGAGAAALEAAVTTETAAKLNIRVGSVVHFPRAEGGPLAVRVTGLVAPPRTGRTLLVHDPRTEPAAPHGHPGPRAQPVLGRRPAAGAGRGPGAAGHAGGARAVLEPGPRPRGPSRP